MKLIALQIRNFKGIKSFEFTPNRNSATVYGDNATGKTTIADAMSWLLFGKNAEGKSDFEIKTLDRDGNPIHHLEHAVFAEFDTGEDTIAFERIYKENWVKQRGQSHAEHNGHTTDYKVNGVPVQKGEFDKRIREMADEKIFRTLTSTGYFNEIIHWQDQRRILLEVVGDIELADVIACDPELAKVADIIGKRTMDEATKVLKARRVETSAEINRIPVRIDELDRRVAELSQSQPAEGNLEELRKAERELQAERERVRSGGETVALRAKYDELTSAKELIKARLMQDQNAGHGQALATLQSAQTDLHQLASQMDRLGFEIASCASAKSQIEAELTQLRADYQQIAARSFEFSQEEVCPSCGQNLPPEKLQAARDEAQAIFNQRKSADLELNNQRGKDSKTKLDQLVEKIQSKESLLAEIAAKHELQKGIVNSLELESSKLNIMSAPTGINDPEMERITQEQSEISAKIKALMIEGQNALDGCDFKISALQNQIALHERFAAKQSEIASTNLRIQELIQNQAALSTEQSRIEYELDLIGKFIRTKVSLLESKINCKFKLARFKLFDTQENGAIVECCETTCGGVPYNSLNTGSRVNVSLDIINTLASHYGFAPPIFVDGAESITNIIPTLGQQIRLVVSELDKSLRVVIDRATTADENIEAQVASAMKGEKVSA